MNLILLSVSLVMALEVAGYFSVRWWPALYGASSEMALKKMAKELQLKFPSAVPPPPPVMGWDSVSIMFHAGDAQQGACRNLPVSNNHDGVRLYKGYVQAQAQVILVGDSFTQGLELADDDTIAAALFRRSGVIAANLGVGGYSPVQAFLLAKEKRRLFPRARVVVLGIMQDNIERMANAAFGVFQPVKRMHAGSFAFRPYMKDGHIEPIDYAAYDSPDSFAKRVRWVMKHDYWARPEHRFPYSAAFVRALLANKAPYLFYHPREQYGKMYENTYLAENLFVLMTMFAEWAKHEQLVPVVFFLPQDLYHFSGPQGWIQRYQHKLPANLIVKALDVRNIPKERYNLTRTGACHPSPYGAQKISEQYDKEIRNILSIPVPLNAEQKVY